MDKKEAYKIVFNDIMKKDIGLFKGIYDAKNGSKSFMYGIHLVLEYITNQINQEVCETFDEMFINNMINSQNKVDKSK